MKVSAGVGDGWRIWLARRGAGAWEYEFAGGAVENPHRWPVQGVYLTREEARGFRSVQRDWLTGAVLVPALYETPIAFAVQERAAETRWSGAGLYVTPCFGGPIPHADRDTVIAVVHTEEEAREFVRANA